MTSYTNHHGLLINPKTNQACGYIFNFLGHGAFAPDGKVDNPLTPEAIQRHNAILSDAEWTAIIKAGRGVLYLTKKDHQWVASNWTGIHSIPVFSKSVSYHNFAGKNGRIDVWFKLDGSLWHGINIGDNQILRVKRTKRPA